MSFKDIQLLNTYKTYKNDVVKEFYEPVLKESILYQRSVGFFSSTALIELTKGISGLISNGGKIQFIVSPYLTQEDIDAINKGYEKKAIIEKALERNFFEPEDYFEEERLNLLAHLIEQGSMDIKVAFTPPKKTSGMYHEKVGIMTDADGNKIVFTGSLNETINAFYNNYESIVVFASWKESRQYAEDMQEDFELLWNNLDKDVEVLEFPKTLREKIVVHKKDVINTNLDEEESIAHNTIHKKGIPKVPGKYEEFFRDYQKDAISTWERNGYSGIFDMATGTGKTYTGLGAITRLFEVKGRLAVIIVCPYQHLVEQWVEDIRYFNMDPIIGYSASKQKKWKQRLKDAIIDFNLEILDFFCFVTTNATYASAYVREQMQALGMDTLLVVDEAHNFGAPSLQSTLYPQIQYRLALSATLERHMDAIGTNALINYFGEKCIEYGLKRAIDEKKLTPYYYYPIVVYLDEDEYQQYVDLSYRISKECYTNKKGEFCVTEKGKTLMLQRARVVAGAKQKITKLKELMQNYINDSHMLVYCGATRVESFDKDEYEGDDKEGERQIVAVSKMLGNELGMKVSHFTSNESAEERELIKVKFASADPYQAIVAIKCLDEGVNIPSIKTAFILASTTNPKEYIQRRGRVLRLAKNKPFATIYDFVTLAKPLDEVDAYGATYQCERNLARKEIARIREFGDISKNNRDAFEVIERIKNTYSIDDNEPEVFDDGSEFR